MQLNMIKELFFKVINNNQRHVAPAPESANQTSPGAEALGIDCISAEQAP
jgi:hypothetical protein